MKTGTVVLALVLVSGCSGEESGSESNPASQPAGTSASSKVSTDNPCELLSFEDLNELTPFKYKGGQSVPPEGDVHRCAYPEAEGDAGAILSLYLGDPDKTLTSYRRIPGIRPAEEVGEEAWWSESRWELIARKGQRVIVVGGIPKEYWARRVAKRVLERM